MAEVTLEVVYELVLQLAEELRILRADMEEMEEQLSRVEQRLAAAAARTSDQEPLG